MWPRRNHRAIFRSMTEVLCSTTARADPMVQMAPVVLEVVPEVDQEGEAVPEVPVASMGHAAGMDPVEAKVVWADCGTS